MRRDNIEAENFPEWWGIKSFVGGIRSSVLNLGAQPFRLLAKVLSSRALGVIGISSVGLKFVDIRRNTNSVGRLLGRF